MNTILSEIDPELKNLLTSDYKFPPDLFNKSKDELSSFFLFSNSTCKFHYLDKTISLLTGYSAKEFSKLGLDSWLASIHPEDLHLVTEKIIDAHKTLIASNFELSKKPFTQLEYRIKKASGEWVWVRDIKCILSFKPDRIMDKVLCKITDISREKELEEFRLGEMINGGENGSKLLEKSVIYRNKKRSEYTGEFLVTSPLWLNKLTKREKEILQLISQGFSTKKIADKLFVTTSTIETHRRHLLEKSQVKNSMELVKEASKFI